MPIPEPRSTPRRADAQRNRDKILEAARAAFAEPDADASMAEISRRAGVGMATLYRNFPGRRELLEALYIDEVDALCQAAETVEAETPGAAFDGWLRRFFTYFTSKRAIASELLERAGGDDTVFGRNRARVIDAGRPLLVTAQNAREIRDDLTLEQILDMVISIAKIPGDADYVEPILQSALSGLRPSVDREARGSA